MCCNILRKMEYPHLGIQMHYGQLALSGAALVIIEATAVEPRGRISYKDPRIMVCEEHGRALKQLISDIKQHTNAKNRYTVGSCGAKSINIVASMGRWKIIGS